MRHPLAWAVWLIAVIVFAFAVANPVYLAIATAALVVGHLAKPTDRGIRGYLIAAAVMTVLRVVVSTVVSNPGTTVLAYLPDLPLLGDAVTAEALVEAVSESLRVTTVLVAFGIANASIDVAAAIRSVPPVLRDAGLVLAIGLSFVPGLRSTVRDVRDAQLLRGKRTLRAIAPSLVVPVLGVSLERAMLTAESMDARGYGRAGATRLVRHRIGMRDAVFALTCVAVVAVAIALARATAWTAYPAVHWPQVDATVVLLALGPGLSLTLR